MIRQVAINNFKSLHDVSAEFKPLTIIIGPNASGKSNLLDALEAVQRLVRFKGTTMPYPIPREEPREERPTILVNEVLWRKANPTISEIFWQIDCHLSPEQNTPEQKSFFQQENESNFSYQLGVSNFSENDIPIISKEQLTANWPSSVGQHIYLSRQGINVKVGRLTRHLSLASEQSDMSPSDLALHYYARPSFPAIMSFRDYVLKWQFYKIIPDQIRSYRFSRYFGPNRRLLKDGSNLANVLHYLSEKQPADFEYIQSEIHSTLGFSRLYTEEEKDDESTNRPGRVHFKAEEEQFADLKPFGPDNLSDGTLGLLALLTVLSVSDPAPLICLEEPERSIHPQLLRRLAYYIREAAQHTQLIITTHSAEFLDHFDPYEQEYLQILIAYRDLEGATKFVPIRNLQNVQKWLEDYMLGQIWTMGQIEETLEIA
jgi:predicted ATPase